MKTHTLILFLLFVTVFVSAQKIDNAFVEGTWKVVSIEESPQDPPFSFMTKSYRKAKFVFNNDQSCRLTTTLANGFFRTLSDRIDNSFWSLSGQSARPSVLIEDNGEKVLEIFVSTLAGETFFGLGEEGDTSYFLLKVVKE